MNKQMECLKLEQGNQPWILVVNADVNYNGFWVNEEVARFNFYVKSGYTKFTYDAISGYDVTKEYKSFGALLNSIFNIDKYFCWTETMVNNAKKAGKQEDKRSAKEAEERFQQSQISDVQAVQVEVVEASENVTNDNDEVNEQQAQDQTEQQAETTYIAYNRSFSAYDKAYNYCKDSDLDPSYIEVVEQSTTSQHALQLDLQLFASDTIQEQQTTFKKPYATYKDGVSKFGIGKYFDLVYTIETTGTDPNLDEMYYSNIQKHERTNIQDTIKLLNLFQRKGYHNIQLWTEIKYKGETIIENGSETQLEFDINDSRLKYANEVNKENEQLKEQIKLYESFLSQYKANEIFRKYAEEQLIKGA